MRRRRDYPLLLASQFLGAFADNAILAVILGQLTFREREGLMTSGQLSAANAIYATLFFIPYVLLAPMAGFVNDRFPKTRWLLGGNFIKLCGTVVAAASVWRGPVWQGLGYCLVGVGACLYSPAKYGVLPEIVDREKLVKANGTVEFLTLVAILVGYVGGAWIVDHLRVITCYGLLMSLYGGSLVLNLFMSSTPAHKEVKLRASTDEFFSNFGELLANRRLFRVLCGTCLFWICGSAIKMNFQPWGINVLGLKNNTQIATLSLWLSMGIMGGAMLAGQFHRVGDLRWTRRYGWLLSIMVGAPGLVESLLGAEWLHSQGPVMLLLILTGLFAGLFLIPLNAALQCECHPEKLGKTIATQNFVDNMGMVAAGAMVFMGARARLNPSAMFLCLSVILALIITAFKVPTSSGFVAPIQRRHES